jgi:hypothetical protein
VFSDFLHDLNPILERHLKVKQTQAHRHNLKLFRIRAQRSVNQFFAPIDCLLPIDTDRTLLVNAQFSQVRLHHLKIYFLIVSHHNLLLGNFQTLMMVLF